MALKYIVIGMIVLVTLTLGLYKVIAENFVVSNGIKTLGVIILAIELAFTFLSSMVFMLSMI